MPKVKSTHNNESGVLNVKWLAFFLIALAIAAPWFDTSMANHAFTKSYVAIIGSGIIFCLTLFYNFSNPNATWKVNHIKITLLSLLCFGALSLFWSVNFDFSVSKLLLWLGVFFCFMIGLSLPKDNDNLIKIAWSLIIAGGVISIIGILQHLFDPFTLTQTAKPASTFGNKNMATQTLALMLPLSVFLLLSKQVQGFKVWGLTTLISLILVYVIYTTTRAVWVSISVEIVLVLAYLIFNKRRFKQWFDWNPNKRNASLFAVVLVLTLIHLSADGFVNFLTIGSDAFDSIVDRANNTSSSRYLIWQTALNMVYDTPLLGSGIGTYAHNLGNEGYATAKVVGYQRVHNDLLELAVGLGLAGIALFSAVVIAILASIIKILKKTEGDTNHFYYLLFVALAGSFVNMQFSFPYQMAVPLVLFGLYVGMIAKQYDIISTPYHIFKISRNWRKAFFGFWLIVFAVVCAIYASWINMYFQLDNSNLKAEFEDLSIVETPIYHRDIQTFLSRQSGYYFKINNIKSSSLIDDQILKHWPNHLTSLYRKSSGAQKMGNNNEALKYAKMLKKVSPKGLFISNIIELLVYNSIGDKDKFLQTYNELLSKPEHLLSIDKNTYHFLLFFTIGVDELSEHPPILYEKYIKHHGYSCEVENNFSIYLFNEEQFESSAQHVTQVLSKDDGCLNPQLIQLLNEKGLINKRDNKIL